MIDEAAAAPGTEPPAAAPGTEPPAAAPGTEPPAAADFYVPEGLPDHMRGQTAEATMDRLFTAFEGMRTNQARAGTVPTEANEYKVEFSESAQAQLGTEDNSAIMDVMSAAMHKNNITDKQAGVLSDIVDGLTEKGLIPAPIDVDEVTRSMAPENFSGSKQQKLEAGAQRLSDNEKWIEAHATRHELSEGVKNELAVLASTSDGLAAIEHIRSLMGQTGVVPAGGDVPGSLTADVLAARQADPRGMFGQPEYNPAFASETIELYKKFHGTS